MLPSQPPTILLKHDTTVQSYGKFSIWNEGSKASTLSFHSELVLDAAITER